MRCLRGRATQCSLPAKATGRSSGARVRVRLAAELLLRHGGLPAASDAAVAAVPRPQGVLRSLGAAAAGAAGRTDTRAAEPARGGLRGEPADPFSLAGVGGGRTAEPILAVAAR